MSKCSICSKPVKLASERHHWLGHKKSTWQVKIKNQSGIRSTIRGMELSRSKHTAHTHMHYTVLSPPQQPCRDKSKGSEQPAANITSSTAITNSSSIAHSLTAHNSSPQITQIHPYHTIKSLLGAKQDGIGRTRSSKGQEGRPRARGKLTEVGGAGQQGEQEGDHKIC